eukprot:SAG31_NODE_44694_length_261_cov_2.376543_1_plen_28_part_01
MQALINPFSSMLLSQLVSSHFHLITHST